MGKECASQQRLPIIHARGAALVDERTRSKPVEGKRACQRMTGPGREQMGEGAAARRNRLESIGAPTAAQSDPADRARVDDRTRVRCEIYESGPLPHEAQAAEGGK